MNTASRVFTEPIQSRHGNILSNKGLLLLFRLFICEVLWRIIVYTRPFQNRISWSSSCINKHTMPQTNLTHYAQKFIVIFLYIPCGGNQNQNYVVKPGHVHLNRYVKILLYFFLLCFIRVAYLFTNYKQRFVVKSYIPT